MSNDFTREPTMEQRVLTRMRVGAHVAVSKALADSLDFKIAEDYMADMLLAQLRAHVLGETVGQHEHVVTFSMPASWWQYFKSDVLYRLLPLQLWRKASLRWPVKMHTIKRTVYETTYATYPYANIDVANLGDRVVFSVWNGPSGLGDYRP